MKVEAGRRLVKGHPRTLMQGSGRSNCGLERSGAPLAGLKEYEAGRHLADARAVTRLSAYVHHGQLSARLLHAETAKRGAHFPLMHICWL